MESIKKIYRIGYGPSSSHTMAPRRAAQIFLENNAETKAIEIKENDGESFEKIILTTDKDLKIKKVHAYLSDGNEFVYEITEFTTNQNLPDSMFTFNESLYPDVEVIDMR